MVLDALNIMALWDAKSIPDRTREMIERKREIGERVGHAPFGYTYRNKRLAPVEKELAIAKLIREKREDENLSYHKIERNRRNHPNNDSILPPFEYNSKNITTNNFQQREQSQEQ